MNKSIFTLFFVLLVGFPQVSSGEGLNLFGKGEGEINLKCVSEGNHWVEYWNIKYKEKTIIRYFDNKISSKYKTTKYEERLIEGSYLDENNWEHTVSINRYSGILLFGYICSRKDIKNPDVCMREQKVRIPSECEVVERKF
jgi:hypothetical protein